METESLKEHMSWITGHHVPNIQQATVAYVEQSFINDLRVTTAGTSSSSTTIVNKSMKTVVIFDYGGYSLTTFWLECVPNCIISHTY